MLEEIKKDIECGKKVGGRPQENLDMEQVNWLIEQVEKLDKIRKAFYDKDTDVIECFRRQIEIFEGTDKPTKKKRS